MLLGSAAPAAIVFASVVRLARLLRNSCSMKNLCVICAGKKILSLQPDQLAVFPTICHLTEFKK
jgi:hypothetical protein